MTIHRRKFIQTAAGTLAMPAVMRVARADTYPSRPVRIIAGFAAGSASDINGRLFGQWFSERLGAPFIVDNHVGAGGNVASDFVIHSAADGYTLLYVSTAFAINETLYAGTINFKNTDLTPVAASVRTPVVMEVNPSLPIKTVPEFIAYAKANPGKINYATVGAGSLQHLTGEYFKMMAGIDMVPVHYRGAAQALPDLIANRVQVMFDIVVSSLSYITGGQVRPIGVASATPQELLPNVPPIAQTVAGFESAGWQGFYVPKGTPADVIDKINREVNADMADPQHRARLVGLGGAPAPGTPDDFGKFVAAETEKWGKVVRQANVKLD
ncbi:MAG TPA: tripartite tricarboxylate transporter substrate binding protein [Xanthobacteraceae bacterium]|jgi:tripartite-type tricarboxylate transporter receptor subunit TctC|nr:tripartite tricarboxylate transporter substrate binding protein [Xanthobacteraceae bacterium]